MKKFLITIEIVILFGIWICMVWGLNAEASEITDEEIVERFVAEKYGDGYDYEIVSVSWDDQEYIHFWVTENGMARHWHFIHRDYYANRYR